MNSDLAIQPGATLGVFGGGQLGRMFAAAAAQMGYRTIVFAPEADCPASHVASEHVRAAYEDTDAVRAFASRCDAVTIEFENVPVACLEAAQSLAPTRPGPRVLAIAQDRVVERAFLDEYDFPSVAHAPVESLDQLNAAIDQLGQPGVVKSARDGYDGRGQVRIEDRTDLAAAWQSLGTQRAIYERWVDHQCELSVLVARSARGDVQTFGPIRNAHAKHILDVSSVPANADDRTNQAAVSLATRIAQALDLEGLICVEMFLTHDGQLLVNEMAPRPHNSGHLTIEACSTSQFQQQVRAVCNLPLGDMLLRRPAAMANLLGDCWVKQDEPDWDSALASSETHLHLYGKPQPSLGRKMGHLTVLDASAESAIARAVEIRKQLSHIRSAANDSHHASNLT